ncbi:MAG: imidazole glycerol phosphate synthase subunit HisH [Armatimonadetes bacterium]|nr:imidazole glycerol phosphate synthase subunit HisH [Armatimonadota bacterium]
MIAIVDYGMGNLRSVEKALAYLGHAARVTSDPDVVVAAERVVLPGVGAFGAAMQRLSAARDGGPALQQAVLDVARSGRPFLGICLGMQLLFTESEEMGHHPGLGLIPGRVRRFDFTGRADGTSLKIPHMGWNSLSLRREVPLFRGLEDGVMVYFVHSYYCLPESPDVVAATADHGGPFCVALWRDNLFATQFHPEKSGAAGLRMLDNFARL